MAEQLLLFADELRTRAKEILVRAASTDDLYQSLESLTLRGIPESGVL